MTWAPVLDGDDATRARRFVAAAVDELARREVTEPSLGYGHAGIALAHGYRALAGDADSADRALASLEHALADVTTQASPWLFQGYAGIGFALHQLAPVVGDVDEPLGHVDALVAQALDVDAWTAPWELLGGLVGLGVYGLERERTGILARVVAHLAATAIGDGDGLVWRTPDRSGDGTHINLGIAHGVAGVIAVLAAIATRPGHPAATEPLLRGAVRWLRSHVQPEAPRALPMTIGQARPGPHELDGWCYGNPSTALVLVRAGHAMNEPAWVTAGHALATRAARRTDAELARFTIDAGVCHGSAGHAYLFHRLGLVLGDRELLDAARAWYLRTLERTVPAEVETVGIQLGLAGIVLAVHAGFADEEPGWARALLVG